VRAFSRRSFVKAFSAMGVGAALAATPVSAAMRVADALRLGDRRYKVSEVRTLMGTSVVITAIHESKAAAESGIAKAFVEIERLAALFDRHQPDTPVSLLNKTGRLTDIAPELYEVMDKAQIFYRRSSGAFDSTVLPLVEMIKRNAPSGGRVTLTKSDLDDALALVDSDALKISKNEICFSKKGMSVTLDGIGKGYIVDRASNLLSACGIDNHLINAGGDIRACGECSAGQPWIVAIEDPGRKGHYPAIIQLKDAAVATSGGYEVYFDADHVHHQTITPQGAVASGSCMSLSVTAPTVMEADALSTSAFVMDSKNAVSFVNSQNQCECLMVGINGDKHISRNWEQMVRV